MLNFVSLPSTFSFTLSGKRGASQSLNQRRVRSRKMGVRASDRHTIVSEVSGNLRANHKSEAATNRRRGPYCSQCATALIQRIPPGDERVRNVCPKCNNVAYENPKLVVGCVPTSKDGERVLLARRAIPPVGKWTVPAGFLELGERAENGAAREVWEETRAKVEMNPVTLMAVYNILPAKQVQMLYRGIVVNEDEVAPGIESQEVRMFKWKDIPWDELAFPTVNWALEYAFEHRHSEITAPQLKNK